jgi:hypothetical protein
MLQQWNKFCFTSGYIEVAVSLPGPDQNTQGYVSIRVSCSSFVFFPLGFEGGVVAGWEFIVER